MIPSIFGHRGTASLAPENSLQSIIKAHDLGADGVEIDVQLSADGELMVFHDKDLTRTTNVELLYPERSSQPLSSFSLAELQRLDAGSWFIEKDPFGQIQAGAVTEGERAAMVGAGIPRLADILEFIKETRWLINIELKSLNHYTAPAVLIDPLLSLVDQVGLPAASIALSSFDHRLLHEIQTQRPDLEVNALIGSNRLLGNCWGSFEFAIYNANAACIDEMQIKTAHEHGCRVNLYTVNDPEQAGYFSRLGVRTLITDFPQLLVKHKS